MKVRRLNRVELLLPGEDIPDAVQAFNRLLGGHLPPPEEVPGQQVISTVDYRLGIEFFGPSSPDSPRLKAFDNKPRRGAIGPLVWEVDDFNAVREEVKSKGYRIFFEYGEPGSRQLHLDAGQLFGYSVTFTERDCGSGGTLPTGVKRFQRVELFVPTSDFEPARQALSDVLGSEIAEPEHVPGVEVLASVEVDLGIELTAPASESSTLKLDTTYPGVAGPLVWEVDDLDQAKANAEANGFRVAYEFGEPGLRQVHFDHSQLYGYKVTFTERRGS